MKWISDWFVVSFAKLEVNGCKANCTVAFIDRYKQHHSGPTLRLSTCNRSSKWYWRGWKLVARSTWPRRRCCRPAPAFSLSDRREPADTRNSSIFYNLDFPVTTLYGVSPSPPVEGPGAVVRQCGLQRRQDRLRPLHQLPPQDWGGATGHASAAIIVFTVFVVTVLWHLNMRAGIWLDKAATVREEKEVGHFRVLSCWYCFCFRQGKYHLCFF